MPAHLASWSALTVVALSGLVGASSAAPPSTGPPSPGPASSPATTTARKPSAGFAWPVQPHRVMSRFRPPATRWGPGHRGVDLEASEGAAVTAPADGVVTFSGVVAGRGVVSIRHPQGFSTTYEPVSDRIAQGAAVTRGQRIARLDPGHCSPTACLHWGYRLGKGTYRDPLTLVRAARPILLPPTPWP